MSQSKIAALMSRVRAGKITKADRTTLRKHAARARRAKVRKFKRSS